MKYLTLGAPTLQELDETVNGAIKKNKYVPIGGVAINPNSTTNRYVQALVREEEEKDEKLTVD